MGFFQSNREAELELENAGLKKKIQKLEEQADELSKLLEAYNAKLEAQQNLKMLLQIEKGKVAELETSCNKLKSSYESLQKEIERLQKEAAKSGSQPAPTPVGNPNPQTENPSSSGDSSKDIDDKLEKIYKLIYDNDRKDQIIKELHDEVQKYSRDIFSQLAKPYLNAIIRIHSNFASMVNRAKQDFYESSNPAAEQLVKKLEPTLLMIQDLLEDEFDARAFTPQTGDKYDPKMHHAVQGIPTTDPEQGGTVMTCKECGFVRIDTGKVIKQAVVVAFRLENPKE